MAAGDCLARRRPGAGPRPPAGRGRGRRSALDVNAAGVQRSKEPEDLVWLVESVQAAVDAPLSLDSANPEALTAALAVVRRTPLVNSISGEAERLDPILPLIAQHDCSVIALAADERASVRPSSNA